MFRLLMVLGFTSYEMSFGENFSFFSAVFLFLKNVLVMLHET